MPKLLIDSHDIRVVIFIKLCFCAHITIFNQINKFKRLFKDMNAYERCARLDNLKCLIIK